MTDLDVMLQQYPQMILTSKSPVTWKGLLTVPNNMTNIEKKVKVKIILPSFPTLDRASVQFGGSIAVLFGPKFKKQITALLSASESVPNFLEELTELIEKSLDERENRQISGDVVPIDMREKLLKELEAVLEENSEVEMSSTKELSTIKLMMNDISMIIQPTVNSSSQNTWRIVSSDLPELAGYSISDKKSYSLKEIRKMFQKQVDMLEDVWEQLRKIDSYCWVTDPLNPKPYQLYRRIYLSPTLSLFLTLNPVDAFGYPQIKFLGTKDEVEKYMNKIADEDCIDKWDHEYSVHENLLSLLDIDEFPQAPRNLQAPVDEAIVGDEECRICFSMESESGEVPDEVCDNQKCRCRFHSVCLFEWLQQVASNKIMFNKIFGPCPNCGAEKSCKVLDNN